jgi:hypothetical protein
MADDSANGKAASKEYVEYVPGVPQFNVPVDSENK